LDSTAPPPEEQTCATATSGRYRVIERRSFGPYALLTLLAPDIAAVAAPGQFVMAALPGARFRLRRPLSVHSVDGERVRLLVEPRGEGTRELVELGVADTLAVAGPLGHGFPLERVRAALLVAGGIGVAPFQFVADVLRARGIPVTATFGFRDEGQARLAGAFEIDDLWVATDDGSVGRHGPAPLLAAVRAWTSAAGLSGYASLEAHMACGSGACHGCVVATREGYLRVCVGGPVFALDLLEGDADEPRSDADQTRGGAEPQATQ
jgi:dihydroorotate dehydrogenase electron transfer subunit